MTRDIRRKALIPAVIVGMLGLRSVSGDIVWDYSPETTGAPPDGDSTSLTNRADQQNFAERISYRWPVELRGMDIYSRRNAGFVGEMTEIRVWGEDPDGFPTVLLHAFTAPVSVVDIEGVGVVPSITRKHVDFPVSIQLLP